MSILSRVKTYLNIFAAFVAAFVYLGLLACTPQANAQGLATGGGQVALTDLRLDERTTGGKLNACELVYVIVYEDHIYRRGDPVFLRGAFNMFDAGPGKGIGLGLKITMFDVVQEKPKLAPIAYAFLSANGQSYAGKEITEGNAEDGGRLVVYDLLAVPTLYEQLLTGIIELNFNRNVGSSDVTVPVNLFEQHPKVAIDFTQCSDKLLEGVKRRLQ
jgi:hypothetical protein